MKLLMTLLAGTLILAANLAYGEKYRGFTTGTLKGTYVFAGRVLINPVVAHSSQQPPQRVLVDCFSIGEFKFDGYGGLTRRVEIRCPTTSNLLLAGLGAPPPLFEPTQQEIDSAGTSFETKGTYQVDADGWGTFADTGLTRLGPLPGNPSSSAGRFALGKVRKGVAHELVLLIDHQSLQGPGAPGLINSDIGASFVARRR